MPEEFIAFQKFSDTGLANEIAERLKEHGIEYVIEDNQRIFEPSFANNTIEQDISLRLRPQDFTRANKVLEEYYRQHLENVDKDYYLFSFTDMELMEIVTRPDEWGHFDYQLAKKILTDRGKTMNNETAELLKKQRYDELAKPQAVGRYWIIAGYTLAVLAGIFGLIMGTIYAWSRKTLPDGKRIYVYREADRNHGVRIFFISLFTTAIWFSMRMQVAEIAGYNPL